MPRFKVKREDLAPGEVLCQHCTALCCKYFSLPIDTPTTWDDYDNIRWYLAHGRCGMFVDDGTWYLVVFGTCQYLTANNMCGIYHERPGICREYTTEQCEYGNEYVFDKYFDHPQQVQEYAEAILPPRKPWPGETPVEMQLPILQET